MRPFRRPSQATPEDRPRRRRRRALLVSAVVLVELAAIGVRSTFATSPFWSETTNSGTSVAEGTLNVSSTTGGVTCQSWTGGASSNTGSCSVTLGGGPFKPGSFTTAAFQVTDAGSINAGQLSLYMSACSASPGLCDAVEFYVQETNSGGTPTTCWYPTAASGSCSFQPFSVGGTGTLTDFTNTYFSSAHGSTLLLTSGPPDLSATTTRYFTLGFLLPTFSSDSVGNSYVNGTATFDLNWYLNTQGP